LGEENIGFTELIEIAGSNRQCRIGLGHGQIVVAAVNIAFYSFYKLIIGDAQAIWTAKIINRAIAFFFNTVILFFSICFPVAFSPKTEFV
jgi:hypothetical protein